MFKIKFLVGRAADAAGGGSRAHIRAGNEPSRSAFSWLKVPTLTLVDGLVSIVYEMCLTCEGVSRHFQPGEGPRRAFSVIVKYREGSFPALAHIVTNES